MQMENRDLLQCVENGLDTLGSSVKSAIFWRMYARHNAEKSEVVSNPTVLTQVIQEIFHSSTPIVEKSVIREINKVFHLSLQESDGLAETIAAARKLVIQAPPVA